MTSKQGVPEVEAGQRNRHPHAENLSMVRWRAAVLYCFGLLTVLAVAVGCSTPLKSPMPATKLPTARAFSDAVVGLIIEDDAPGLWRMMESRFRKAVTEAEARTLLDQMYARYGGRVLEAEFKSEAVGQKMYADGTSNSMQKFWYAVRTTEHAKGKYFVFVEVVPEGQGFACSGFALVTFPGGAPPWLR